MVPPRHRKGPTLRSGLNLAQAVGDTEGFNGTLMTIARRRIFTLKNQSSFRQRGLKWR
jgi:hypothetical protein